MFESSVGPMLPTKHSVYCMIGHVLLENNQFTTGLALCCWKTFCLLQCWPCAVGNHSVYFSVGSMLLENILFNTGLALCCWITFFLLQDWPYIVGKLSVYYRIGPMLLKNILFTTVLLENALFITGSTQCCWKTFCLLQDWTCVAGKHSVHHRISHVLLENIQFTTGLALGGKHAVLREMIRFSWTVVLACPSVASPALSLRFVFLTCGCDGFANSERYMYFSLLTCLFDIFTYLLFFGGVGGGGGSFCLFYLSCLSSSHCTVYNLGIIFICYF